MIDSKTEELAVRLINEYYDEINPHGEIGADYLRAKMQGVDIKHLIDLLVAKGIIAYKAPSFSDEKSIIRLGPCITYSEDKEKAKKERSSKFRHDWLIAIFTTVIGALLGAVLSEPLWGFLHSLF